MQDLQIDLAIHLHRTQPWIPNFLRVLVRPTTKIECGMLEEDVRIGTQIMYTPSYNFWKKHVLQCHDGGRDCNVRCHVDYLTKNGTPGFYEYGVQLTDLSFHKFGPEEFAMECKWWKENYPKWLEYYKKSI